MSNLNLTGSNVTGAIEYIVLQAHTVIALNIVVEKDSKKGEMRWWILIAALWHLAVLVALTVPPLSNVLLGVINDYWPPSTFFRATSLMHGAHESILVTECCRLKIFDTIERHRDTGISLEVLASTLNLEGESLAALLQVLQSLSLVSLSQGKLWNRRLTSEYFVSWRPDYMCGMGIVGNHVEILKKISSLDTSLFATKLEEPQFLSLGDDRSLWDDYAQHSGMFSRSIGSYLKRVATEEIDAANQIVDIGCGSGQFLSEIGNVNPAARLYCVDLPGVVRKAALGNVDERLIFVSGDIFDESFFVTISDLTSRKPALVILNSFLQHLSEASVVTFLGRLSTALPSGSSIVVVELTVPDGSYSVWTELVPMSRLFDVVLRTFTHGGGVRTQQKYEQLGVMAGLSLHKSKSLFPIPATALVFSSG